MSNVIAPWQWVDRVQLDSFRSYPELDTQFSPGLNVFVGPNGVGKTNLLEALAYVTLGRSPRTSRDADLILSGRERFAIELSHRIGPLTSSSGESLKVDYQPDRGRRVCVDGRAAPGPSILFGRLLAVFFSPDDLWLLKGAPASRRALLDRLLVQAFPIYADALSKYRHALAQRNATLRDVRARRAGRGMLAIWEPQLVQYGAELLRRRADAVAALSPLAGVAYRDLAGEPEALGLRFVPGLDEATPSTDSWQARLGFALERDLPDDIAAGTTASGPHRDDVEATINGRSARRFASQGQQRSAVLAIKFAERSLLRSRTGRIPILLVDDVLSELDPRRRHALTELLAEEGQVFLTTADEQQARALDTAALYLVMPGSVKPLPSAS